MVSIHQSGAGADQNKTRFVVVWIYIFDSSDYSRKILLTFGAWTRFFLSESYGLLFLLELISHIQPVTEFLERYCRIISFSLTLLVSLIVLRNHYSTYN